MSAFDLGPQELRDRILDAAERLVLEKGYANASIDVIAGAAGTDGEGFLRHFADTSDMLLALIGRSLERFSASVRQCADFLPDMPAKMLKAHVLAWMRERGRVRHGHMAFLPELLDNDVRHAIAECKRRHAENIRPPELSETTFELIPLACNAIGLDLFMKGLTAAESAEYRRDIAQELFRIIDQAMGEPRDSTAANRELMADLVGALMLHDNA